MSLKLKKGFSLVELIVTISVLGVLMISISMAMAGFIHRNAMFRQREIVHRYENEARLALLQMVRDIRQSYSLVEPSYVSDEVLVLRSRVEINTYFTITYSHGYVDVFGGEFLTRNVVGPHNREGELLVDLATTWPIGFVPAAITGIHIQPIKYARFSATPNVDYYPFVATGWQDASNPTHVSIRIETPDAAPDFQGMVIETTVAIQRRP